MTGNSRLAVWTTGLALLAACAPASRRSAPAPGLGAPGTLAQELAAASRSGLPTRPRDMVVSAPPPAHNAGTYYTSLMQFRQRSQPEEERAAEALRVDAAMGASDRQVARRGLAHRPQLLRLIHRAAACERCVFKRDWSQGPAMLFPEFATMRFAARWLRLQAMLHASEGHPVQAAETLALGFRVARHAASDPLLIAYLVAEACDAITMGGLRSLLYASARDPKVARAVERAAAGRARHSFAFAMRGELVTGLVCVDIARQGGTAALRQLSGLASGQPTPAPPAVRTSPGWQRLMDDNAAYILWYDRLTVEASGLPFAEQKALSDRLQADLDRRGAARDLRVLLPTIVLPVFGRAVAKEHQTAALSACIRAGAAVLAYRAARGRLPGRLADALSPVPADPYDGRPLRYHAEGNGFVVYSVGETLKFDGGTAGAKPPATESLFRWPRPSYL